ncbi:TPA: hypothetical protein I7730_16090 [Vibrio vulnificus]|uniref:Uncharacterized protein n=1 Tax=Vibrio vulnificus TaxID=672 RepID=A0A8H9N1V7_VIBVL|nr:hypothetical protein [Vibrio vulnificus]HAS8541304.1 hypothetical protein [Vibrio vulnificus]
MGGNKKHGYMSGNRAGRNGVGQPKGFYCEACQKDHGPSVEKVGISSWLGTGALTCNKKYLQAKQHEFNMNDKRNSFINILKRRKMKIRSDDESGTKHRIDFMIILLKSGLYKELMRYDLFDEHNIGERDVDKCFEMGDGREVVHGILEACKGDLWLRVSMNRELEEQQLKHWNEISQRHLKEISSNDPQLGLEI